VFNIKSDSCYRSWLVVKGFSQVERIDFDKLFSLVVYHETVYLFLAVTALKDWDSHSVDIKTAYLYGNLDRKSIWSNLKVSGYLAKKRKSSDSTKNCTALSKPAYLGGGLWLS